MDAVTLSLAGLEVHAPASVITNLLLCGQCTRAARRLPGRRPSPLWAAFFACLAVGAGFGALKHGFPDLPPAPHGVVRFLSNVGLGAAVTMAQLASIRRLTSPGRRRTAWTGAAVGQFVVFLAFSLTTLDFLVPALDLAVGMTPVLVAEGLAGLRGRESSRWVAGGLAVALLGGAVYGLGLSPAPWFNHVDVAHLVLMGTVALVYRGATMPGRAPWS